MTDAEPGWKWSENRNEDVAGFTDRQICSAYPTDESKPLINQSSLFVIAESVETKLLHKKYVQIKSQ
jgi:hypothetical protein